MNKRLLWTLAGLALVLCLMSNVALAEETPNELPQWHMELKVSPYKPLISENTAKQSFYEIMYGESKPMALSFATHNYVWKGFGLLGVGAKIGYWKTTGKAQLCTNGQTGDAKQYLPCTPSFVWQKLEDPGTDTASYFEDGNGTTQLAVMPLSFEIAYRLDYLNRQWGIPFEAYTKLSFDYHLWWATTEGETAESTRTDENGETTTVSGSGGTPGMTASVGLMLNLDWLEPLTAVRARKNGIAGSYLFVEWNWIKGDGFDQGKRLDLSSSSVAFGLAMDFI